MRGQRLAFDKLHDDEIDAVDFFDRVNGDDVWMIQDGSGLRFGKQTTFGALVASGLGCEQFERDVAAEFRVFRTIDLAHPAFTYLVDNAVVQQPFWFNRTHRFFL